MVQLEQKRIWQVIFKLAGNYPPKTYIKENLTLKERRSIYDALGNLENIKYPRDFPNTKYYSHDGTPLYQLAVGDFRIYFHLDSAKNRLVVCYACRKVGRKARRKDLDRTVASIQDYINENPKE